jgi:hypothetical protein
MVTGARSVPQHPQSGPFPASGAGAPHADPFARHPKRADVSLVQRPGKRHAAEKSRCTTVHDGDRWERMEHEGWKVGRFEDGSETPDVILRLDGPLQL